MERKFNDQELARRTKLQHLVAGNNDPFITTKFIRTHDSESFKAAYSQYTKEQLHDLKSDIKIAGRVMAIRQTFGVLQDFAGRVQFYLNKKSVAPEVFERFKNHLDIGDIIGIEGSAMRTNSDELTVRIENFQILAKALKPLPEKFHGLVDEEERARHRYVDLIMNRDSLNNFVLRSKIIALIREFFNNEGFIEVETPVLQPILGGASARPFVTYHNTLEQNFYLRVATELPLKKLIVGGFEKVYEIGRIFRNEGMDSTHNPEFTSIEAYQAYVSMEEIMDLVEATFRYVASKLQRLQFTYKNISLDFTKPFKRVHMVDFIKEITGIDFWKVTDLNETLALAQKHNISLQPHQKNLGHIINAFFEHFCEQACLQPTFVYGHPLEVSPLAKKDPNNPRFTQRFELFINQKEYANAFSELNDPIDQYERFKEQLKERQMGNHEANEMDYDYIEALEYGLPPTGGLGIGIDRMVMLFTSQEAIRNVLLFPHLRNLK